MDLYKGSLVGSWRAASSTPCGQGVCAEGPSKKSAFPTEQCAGISANVLMTLVGCIIFAKFVASSIGDMKLISEPASISGRVPFL